MLCMNNEKTFSENMRLDKMVINYMNRFSGFKKHQKELPLPDILQYEKKQRSIAFMICHIAVVQ